MPRKNARPKARKAKLRLATKDGKKTPSQFRRDNPQIKSHMALAVAYAFHSREGQSDG